MRNLVVTVAARVSWGECSMVDTPAVEEPFAPASEPRQSSNVREPGSAIHASSRGCSPPRCGSGSAITACARCSRCISPSISCFRDQHGNRPLWRLHRARLSDPADRRPARRPYLGSKRSVKFGAIVMAIGYFTLAFGGEPAKPYRDDRRPALRGRHRSFQGPADERPAEARYIRRRRREAADSRQ